MNLGWNSLVGQRFVKGVAAVVIGLGIGSLVPPDPVRLPAVGVVPGVVVGGIAIGLGLVLYTQVPKWTSPPECGCVGDCDCGSTKRD